MSMYDLVKRRRGSSNDKLPVTVKKEKMVNRNIVRKSVSMIELDNSDESDDEEINIDKPIPGLTKEDVTKAIEIIKKERPDVLIVKPSDDEDCNKVGELLWARWNGNYYPALTVSGQTVHLRPASSGKRWVLWLAEGKVSEVCDDALMTMSAAVNCGFIKELISRSDRLSRLMYRGLSVFGEELIARRDRVAVSYGISFTTDKVLERLMETRVCGCHDVLSENSYKCIKRLFRQHQQSYVKLITDEVNYKQGTIDIHDDSDSDSDEFGPRIFDDDQIRIFQDLREGVLSTSEVCLACGISGHEDEDITIGEHPVFQNGGLCSSCCDEYRSVAYSTDMDGSFNFCTVCMRGGDIVQCSNYFCGRGFCRACLELLVGPLTWNLLVAMTTWECYLCDQSQNQVLLTVRADWMDRLYELCLPVDHPSIPPLPRRNDVTGTRPMRVLSMFDGISAGRVALQQAGLNVEFYCASEIDEEAMRVSGKQVHLQLGDIFTVTSARLRDLLPFDLVLGGSPCNELSLANPWRKGVFGGSGLLFFEFYRILTYLLKVSTAENRPLFWLYENVQSMRDEDCVIMSQYFGRPPVLLDAKHFSAQHRARYFWGNLPGMYSADTSPMTSSTQPITLQSCLTAKSGRLARVKQIGCVTTTQHSGRGSLGSLPVEDTLTGELDSLWVSELELLFGLPQHYTDCNLTLTSRRRLIGKSWCVPMIAFLLRPLREVYKTENSE